MKCSTFQIKRNCLFGKLSSINPKFLGLTENQQLLTLLCPPEPKSAKLVNKFINIVFTARKRIDGGEPIDRGNFVYDYSISDDSESDTEP